MTRTKIVAVAGLIAALSTSAALADTVYTVGPKNIFEGVYSADQASRGKQIYMDSCANCHGSKGGGGPAAPPLTGSALDYKAGGTLADVMDFMIMAMPPEAPGKLRNKEYSDVLAFMLELHGAPAGETELPYKIKELGDFEIIETPADLPPPAPKAEGEEEEEEVKVPFNDGH
ncbi:MULTISPECIES: cytochrome c [unclassified Devosia]|uniref:c-type cytochrome n=1 Tax=unclassified Devosia TaxID=196773 RepID=UPI00145E3549|nr:MULTISPECIES: cytochrome c [unclassified Devosia]MBJ6987914.1 cytochrome c [Devosia sp. MC521]MBK1796071.1 cytochrome c [Devosia sp. WQ 349K1]QMW63814.1 cytochrome c [Devosia sp. MC521]